MNKSCLVLILFACLLAACRSTHPLPQPLPKKAPEEAREERKPIVQVDEPPPENHKTTSLIGEHEFDVTSINITGAGGKLVTGDLSGLLRVWNTDTHETLATFKHTQGRVFCCDFSPEGQSIISGGEDGSIYHWRVRDGSLIHTYKGMQLPVRDLEFHPDGRTIASASSDGKLRLWNVENRTLLGFSDLESGRLFDLEFSPDGKSLAVSGETGRLHMLDARTLKPVFSGRIFEEPLRCLSFGADGQTLVLGGYYGSVRFLDIDSNKMTEPKVLCAGGLLTGVYLHDNELVTVDSRNGVLIRDKKSFEVNVKISSASVISFSGTRQVFATNAQKTKVLLWFGSPPQLTIDTEHGEVTGLEYTPDGRFIITIGADGLIKIWDAEYLSLERIVPVTTDALSAMAISPDGKEIAVARRSDQSINDRARVYTYDIQSGTQTRRIKTATRTIYSLEYNPDGTHLAVAGSDFHASYSLKGGLDRIALPDWNPHVFWAVRYSPDAKYRALIGTEYDVRIEINPDTSDATAGAVGRYWPSGSWSGPYCADFHPKSIYLALAGKHGRIVIMDVFEDTVAARFFSMNGSINAIKYSPDGKWLATCGEGVVEFWQPFTGKHRRSDFFHAGQINDLAFSPDQRYLASVGDDGRVIIRKLSEITGK